MGALIVLLIALFASRVRSISHNDLYSINEVDKNSYLPESLDDTSSPEIQLTVPIQFYGRSYRSLFVNSNGHISFRTEIPSFSNSKFPLSFPVIAPLYTDVDTRGSGRVYYREINADPKLTEQHLNLIKTNFAGAEAFVPGSLFVTTWDKVGYYDTQNDKVNTFQVVIAADGSDTYALFLYPENGIQWIQSQGKNPNFPDARAQAGFISETREYYSLQGSGTEQVANLERLSNVKVPGLWIFHIGSRDSNTITPPKNNNEIMKENTNVRYSCASHGTSVCHSSSKCEDYTAGFCCKCNDGLYGNGQNCLPKNEALRVNGKINGILNGVRIKDVDFHSFVTTEKGRIYNAISRIPANIGHDMQSLPIIGSAIGWLFAIPATGAKNGYELTGGVLNRTVEVEFPQTGNHVAIKQYFKGLDAFGYLEMMTDITGSVPAISEGTKMHMNDFDDQFTKVEPGLIKLHSRHSYEMGNSRLQTPFAVDETIQYNECVHEKKDPRLETLRMRTAKNYIVYNSDEQIVRYSMTNRVTPIRTANPCRDASCGSNSNCVADRESYKCVCDSGYTMVYNDVISNKGTCDDMDECTTGRHNCHVNAECTNMIGSFMCRCSAGYSGNGVECEKTSTCQTGSDGRTVCVCDPGYVQEGDTCVEQKIEIDCRTNFYCHDHADCVLDQTSQKYACKCDSGFIGDGTTCQSADDCRTTRRCNPHASCQQVQNIFKCVCDVGYVSDGSSCRRETAHIDCRRTNYCHEFAACVYNQKKEWAECRCQDGYRGDGATCERKTCDEMNCHSDATCRLYQNQVPVCVCNPGFAGDGYRCPKSDEHIDCRRVNNCHTSASCVFNSEKQWAECQCRPGFKGDGIRCEAERSCDEVNCNQNENCQVGHDGLSQCVCNDGFKRIANVCQQQPTHIDCRRVNNCHENAVCAFNDEMQWAECQCRSGYKGDGIFCEKYVTCENLNCDVNAGCRFRSDGIPECICNAGYIGDGYVCQLNTTQDCRVVNICDPYADCLYNEVKGVAKCECYNGYVGDGITCQRKRLTCENFDCDKNSTCIYTEESAPTCICNDGFTIIENVCQPSHVDCRRVNNCHENAVCAFNTEMQWAECQCRSGYEGDGMICERDVICEDLACDVNAGCRFRSDGLPECVCVTGYIGDGYVCRQNTTEDCRYLNICDINANCIYDEESGVAKCLCYEEYVGDGRTCESRMLKCEDFECGTNATCQYIENRPQCFCNAGYIGDGYVCTEQVSSICQSCDVNARCILNETASSYQCFCKSGFKGDGINCQEEGLSCNVLNRCDPHAMCEYSLEEEMYQCVCNNGYQGDGYQCTVADDVSCDVVNTCSANADCIYKFYLFGYVCQCKEGFAGDGYTCQPLDECSSVDDCDFNAECIFDDVTSRYICQCLLGYIGDGKSCTLNPNAGCDVLKDCHPDALCSYDAVNQRHKCRCNPGFEGDGLDCITEQTSCSVVNNCDSNADCVYEYTDQLYRCQCRQGFRGNGFTCIPTVTCADEPRLCHSHADCLLRDDLNQYVCQCRVGYTGDGSICRAVPKNKDEFLLFNQGMSVLQMPFEVTRTDKGKILVMEPSQIAVGIDVDCYKGYVYWSDIAQPQIKRSYFNGSNTEVILSEDLKSPEGIAIDWVSKNIYWTDSVKDTVEVMSLEGNYRKVIVRQDLKNPRGIAVHPSREKLYWADWHRNNPRIEMANLDGSNRKTLVSDGLSLPNALTIDYSRDELCWVDAGEKKIECMGMQDGRRRTIASPVAYPFGLTTHRDIFYWTDWKEKFIHKLKRGETEAEKIPVPLGGNGRLYSIVAVPSHCPKGSNSCAIQNGGCQFICLPNGQGNRTCACPDNLRNATAAQISSCNEIN